VEAQDHQDDTIWLAPAPAPKTVTKQRRHIGRTAGILGIGVVAGSVLAIGLNANASSNSTSTPATARYDVTGRSEAGAGPHGQLALSGTVTAVGSGTVTIKTSSATTEYVVDANSDIDKNGEAKLSDLKVGDLVQFSTVTTNGKATIDILHSGDEAKNRPAGPPPGDQGSQSQGG
jgi:hypothetical protein